MHGLRAARDPLDNELGEVSRTDKDTGKDDQPGVKDHGKRPDSGQSAKAAHLDIHEERTLAVDDGPEGSRFLGHRAFTVQDLRIGPHNTRFLLERWATPDGRVLTAACPPELGGLHFGPGLRAFILYQHHHCHVTQPKLHEQLREWGLDVSLGQIDALLASGQEAFSAEKASLLKTGLEVSSAVTVDDSGAPHQGQNGYVTVVSGPTFAWFGSADNKSRIGFLTHLHDREPSYALNDIALRHLHKQGLKAALVERLQTNLFAGDDWAAYLDRLGIRDERHRGRLVGRPRGQRHPSDAGHRQRWRRAVRPPGARPVLGAYRVTGTQADSVQRAPARRARTRAPGNLGLLCRSQPKFNESKKHLAESIVCGPRGCRVALQARNRRFS